MKKAKPGPTDTTPEGPTLARDRADKYLPPEAAKLYAHVLGEGLNVSGPDKVLREVERLTAESDPLNRNQIARRRELTQAQADLEDARLSAAAIGKAVTVLRTVTPQPDGLAGIIAECASLARRCDVAHVEAERLLHGLASAFKTDGDRLRALTMAAQKASIEAGAAVVAVGCTHARRVGEQDAEVFRADPFLVERPEHAPDSVRDHYREIKSMAALVGDAGMRIEAAYFAGCGKFDEVVRQAVEAPGLVAGERGMRPTAPAGVLANL